MKCIFVHRFWCLHIYIHIDIYIYIYISMYTHLNNYSYTCIHVLYRSLSVDATLRGKNDFRFWFNYECIYIYIYIYIRDCHVWFTKYVYTYLYIYVYVYTRPSVTTGSKMILWRSKIESKIVIPQFLRQNGDYC